MQMLSKKKKKKSLRCLDAKIVDEKLLTKKKYKKIKSNRNNEFNLMIEAKENK